MAWVGPKLQRDPRVGDEGVMQMAQVAGIASPLIMALTPAVWSWLLFPLGFVVSVSWLWTPLLRAQISRQLDPQTQGELQGAVASVSGIASLLSTVLASAIFSATSDPTRAVYCPQLVVVVAAAINLIAAIAGRGTATTVEAPSDGEQRKEEPWAHSSQLESDVGADGGDKLTPPPTPVEWH